MHYIEPENQENQTIALGDVVDVFIEDDPPGIKSENARLAGCSLVDTAGLNIGTYVEQAQIVVNKQLKFQLDIPLLGQGNANTCFGPKKN